MSARAGAALLAAAALAAGSAQPAGAAPATWKSRMASAERYAKGRAGTITFAVVDESGRLHGYHARSVAPSASVLKAMLLVAYLRRADVRARPLHEWEKDLLEPMIRRSDNTAAARMVGLVGARRLNRLAHAAGMEHFELHWPVWGASEVTPRGQALFFHRIDRLVPARHRRYALHLLATVVPSQRWGVGRVAHGRWHLYFKGGWSSGTGLVDHQSRSTAPAASASRSPSSRVSTRTTTTGRRRCADWRRVSCTVSPGRRARSLEPVPRHSTAVTRFSPRGTAGASPSVGGATAPARSRPERLRAPASGSPLRVVVRSGAGAWGAIRTSPPRATEARP